MERLFDATQTMKDLASFTRAQSMAGALFQITFAYDCVLQLQQNKVEETQQEELHDQLGRLLYSAAGVIKRELPDKPTLANDICQPIKIPLFYLNVPEVQVDFCEGGPAGSRRRVFRSDNSRTVCSAR
jgi:hypothetical protein